MLRISLKKNLRILGITMKKSYLLSALVSVALLAFASCGDGDSGADVEVAVPVSVEEMTPGSIEEFVTATGTVKASMEVTITAETG